MKLHVHELRSGVGRPLVLLHGWMGCGTDFQAVADAPAMEGRTVLAVDLPGHGATEDYDREYDFSDVAPWLAKAITAEVFDLVGYSLGGRVAMYFAATHRARVATLTLLGAHPGIEHPIDQRQRLELDAERASRLLAEPADFIREWDAMPLFGTANSDAWEAVRARRTEELESHAYGWARSMLCLSVGRQIPLWHVATSLALPTLFAAGEHDAKYVEAGQMFAEQNPGYASFFEVADAAHATHLDAPAEVARLICR